MLSIVAAVLDVPQSILIPYIDAVIVTMLSTVGDTMVSLLRS